MECIGCGLELPKCLCGLFEEIYAEHREVFEDPAAMEELEKVRCLSCFFRPCRCAPGLKDKRCR